MKTRDVLLLIAPILVLAPGFAGSAVADGTWEDGPRALLEARVRALEAIASGRSPSATLAERAVPGVRVDLRHGEARFVADLARVDVTLAITNTTGEPVEWTRDLDLDERAEVVGASLTRAGAPTILCRTLTMEDANRIYGEARNPQPRTTQPRVRPGRDPLLVERPEAGRLHVVVWPVNANETVRVNLTFVSPLRGRGRERVYVDPIGGIAQGLAADVPVEAELLVRPGDLSLVGTAAAFVPAGAVADALRFVDAAAAVGPLTDAPSELRFEASRIEGGATAVRGGGLGARTAVWRFDAQAFLRRHDLDAKEGLELRLVRVLGSTLRVAPDRFGAYDEPLPVAARLAIDAETARYDVEVRDGGDLVGTFREDVPVDRVALDPELEDAMMAWYRSRLVARTIEWAGGNGSRRRDALRYAVDAGVLVPGTAALALPAAERRSLPSASRRLFDHDGIDLGGSGGAADLTSPPTAIR